MAAYNSVCRSGKLSLGCFLLFILFASFVLLRTVQNDVMDMYDCAVERGAATAAAASAERPAYAAKVASSDKSQYDGIPNDGVLQSSLGLTGTKNPLAGFGGFFDVAQLNIQNVHHDPPFFMTSTTPQGTIQSDYSGESHLFRLMTRVIQMALKLNPAEGPQVLDAGANQGWYSLTAGVSGARYVYSFEPQPHLQKIMRMSARLNLVDDRIFIYPNAVLDTRIKARVKMSGDGGIAHIVGKRDFEVESVRLDEIKRHLPSQPIAYLKVDIEGFEVAGIRSAAGLFEKSLVRNVVVEWGPPARWAQFKSSDVPAALSLLNDMHLRYGFELAVLPSAGFASLVEQKVGEVRNLGPVSQMIAIGVASYEALMTSLDTVGELYLWFYQPSDQLNIMLLEELENLPATYDATGRPQVD
ncbi:hypothetical protein HDU87_001471 [Geranomyces variabilis]|uniref:Methyltransferase FkbM domain-containing protein n=1 Tax=Geranomyces variabilis TaxID=109894 RepID=A0AAD5TB25_9FUNG|nr:hypothetical protein HDU87_001471 [Geranomyces variabilis]